MIVDDDESNNPSAADDDMTMSDCKNENDANER
jgi:hypothetical protein